MRRVPNLSKAKSKVPRGMRTMKMTVAGAARSDSNSEQTGEHIGKCVHFNCPSLSKWLFGIPEQDRSTLEQEARRVAGHSRRIWIKGKGQPNVEEDLKLKLAFIHSLHFFTSRASKHPLQWNPRPLSPVLRAHDLQNAILGDQRERWRALGRDPLFDCRLSASHSRGY